MPHYIEVASRRANPLGQLTPLSSPGAHASVDRLPHEPSTESILASWHNLDSPDRALWVTFQDPKYNYGFWAEWLSGVAYAVIGGMTISIAFLLVGCFPMARVPGSSFCEHMLCVLGGYVAMLGLASYCGFFNPRIRTIRWYLYNAVCQVPALVVRLIIE